MISNMYEIIQERDQYKTERDTLIDDLSWYKAKVSRLERENEDLKFTKKMHLGHIKYFSNNNELLRDEVKSLKQENKALRLQADTYFEQWQKENHKAKAFDEVRKYALNKHDEFEDRKDRARNQIEYDYFSTLQIANNAVINKCKQLEDE